MSGLLQHKEAKIIIIYQYTVSDGRRDVLIEFVNGEFKKLNLKTSPTWTRTDVQLIAECYKEIERLEAKGSK